MKADKKESGTSDNNDGTNNGNIKMDAIFSDAEVRYPMDIVLLMMAAVLSIVILINFAENTHLCIL